ncbi:methylated-DNA--protein-cysteine methyltransferase [Amylibacter marinus]|uniref:Methylated-DNA--protein-cysteine methyltransferase n=1 Tax=Amylibacter marinus TaxID=1475483 RepID=A0ABQ5VY01_9RHOB|nr:methylated-DNA--[protein]-cysteine S-methyltransferase [Amylibacter marinus]GLQ36096.1 methylated-DNA--protein-cysteine methyltransferase [Amylibacter marinus]
MNIGTVLTPLGQLAITEQGGAITHLNWRGQNAGTRSDVLKEALAQVSAFFDRRLENFDLPLAPDVTEFQAQVLDQINGIKFGHTRTYGQIADEVGGAAQAVGNACGANPIPLIIPCHRVLGADTLGGYSGAGGVETKVWFLKFEGAGLLI